MRNTRQENIETAGEQARENIHIYGSCSQAVVGAFRHILGDGAVPEAVFKASTGLSGGGAGTGSLCGALSAGLMVISLFSGRDFASWSDNEKKEKTAELGKRLIDHFQELYGSMNCCEIKENISRGKTFPKVPPESIRILENGEREADCRDVTRRAAMKVMEILQDEGFIR